MAIHPEFNTHSPASSSPTQKQNLDFQTLAELALNHIELACDTLNDTGNVDIDNQRLGVMLTLTFPNQNQIVINLQKPLSEIWMATPDGGYHYRWTGVSWLDTKTNDELFATLSKAATKQCQTNIIFTAPLAL